MIRSKVVSSTAIVFLLLAARPLLAEICAVDSVPAATLLLPYFEVDLDQGPHAGNATTFFSVINTTAEPTLVKAILWTDLGIPTLSFEIYLTGFDVFTANLRDLFVHGRLPVTGVFDSNQGVDSLPNTPFPGCETESFGGDLSPGFRSALIAAHTGAPSDLFGGQCGAMPRAFFRRFGSPDPGTKARGFLTLDVVRRCSSLDPTTIGYFGPEGVASFDNRLIGDFFFIDPANEFAQGEQLVRLEASSDLFGHGDRTFYAPFVGGDGSDGREPLPTRWASRYLQGGGFSGGTQIIAWRGLSQTNQPFDCSAVSTLRVMTEIYAFDEEENSSRLFPDGGLLDPPPPIDSENPFPFAAGRLSVGEIPLYPNGFGWMTFDMATSVVLAPRTPIEEIDPFSQAWIGSTFDASGRFSVGMGGSPLSPPCNLGGCLRGDVRTGDKLCILGAPSVLSFEDATLSAGDLPVFEVRSRLCDYDAEFYSLQRQCWATDGKDLTYNVDARFCSVGEPPMPPPVTCRIPLEARCSSTQPLQDGIYAVHYGELTLQFQVPSTIPVEGLCVSASD